MPACSPDKIVAALHEEAENITDIVREKIKLSDRLALRLVPDGGTVRRHSNQDSIIYGEARQASIAYRDLNHDVRALQGGKEFPGRTVHGANGIFENYGNQVDDNACHGQVTIDFSQGFRKRSTIDKGIDLDTPIKCARELDRQGEAHIRGYFEGFKNQFTRFGMDNFADNLLNLCIQFSEANASVRAADEFNVTSGGWEAPPLYRISIHFLQDYRDHIMAELRGRGMEVAEDWMLEVEMPRIDWMDAVIADQVQRNPSGTTYNTEVFKDNEGPMKNRQFAVYGGIKCYFNETPIRGYFKKIGTVGGVDQHQFVRVYDWINKVDEEAGLITGTNHDYRRDSIVVDGIKYDMVTLLPHIDPRSFKRYGLIKPLKPYGSSNAGVNYEVRVIDGARLGGNDFDDKFKFAARHEFRFKAIYPEFSGFIAYRAAQRAGYVLEVNSRNYGSAVVDATAAPEAFLAPGPDKIMTAGCDECGQVAEADGTCVDAGDADGAIFTLTPSGANEVAVFGANVDVKLEVRRTGGASGAASVEYFTTAGTATAGADFTATSGVLNWAAGDTSPKYITVPFLAAATDGQTVSVGISDAVGGTIATGADEAVLTILA